MPLALYAHPFAAYCWKVLVALWANDVAFEYRNLDDAEVNAEWRALSPFGKMPVLVDGGATVLEASIIVEYLQLHHPGPAPMLPADPAAALEVRLLDRLADNYLSGPMQAIVFDRLRDEDRRDPLAVEQARATLDTAYAWWDDHMGGREWANGDAFSLADCAVFPALFYLDWVHPIPGHQPVLRAYRTRLNRHPACARAIEEARPYRALFPFGDPGRD